MNSGELLWLKIAFAAAVAAVGLLGTLLPWIFGGGGTSERALALSDTFAGGVLGGAGIIHLLSGGLGQFRTALPSLGYPLALLLAGIGFLLNLPIEGVIVAGHPGHDSPPPQRASAAVQHEVDWHPGGTRSPTYPVILLIVLSVHSVILGLALGAQGALSGAVIVFLAIVAHKASGSASPVALRRTVGMAVAWRPPADADGAAGPVAHGNVVLWPFALWPAGANVASCGSPTTSWPE